MGELLIIAINLANGLSHTIKPTDFIKQTRELMTDWILTVFIIHIVDLIPILMGQMIFGEPVLSSNSVSSNYFKPKTTLLWKSWNIPNESWRFNFPESKINRINNQPY